MTQPRVSVVIPSYNHGQFIGEAVTSVLAADPPVAGGLELVVVDDGSSDDSLERLASFRSDDRVRIFTQANQGAHAALNRAISLSRGEILFILNSDDIYAADRISCFCERFADDPELTLLVSWLELIDEQGHHLGVKQGYHNLPPWPPPRPGPRLADTGELHLALLETNFIATTSNLAFRRTLIEGGPCFLPLRYAHDWDFFLAAFAVGKAALIERPLMSYRVHGTNTIREGEQDTGQGLMRFEIMWVVARHALATCRRFAGRSISQQDLVERLWNSLPRFGCEAILSQLLQMRGDSEFPPPPYDALLNPHHPFRRHAIQVLTAATG